jgi:hypothetical protein
MRGSDRCIALLVGMGLVSPVKPEVDDRVVGIADQMMVFSRLEDEDLASVDWLTHPIDLDLAASLHDAEHLVIVVDVGALLVVRTVAHGVKAEPATRNIRAGDQLGGDVFGTAGAQVRKRVPFHLGLLV